jgi:hypothetical protein
MAEKCNVQDVKNYFLFSCLFSVVLFYITGFCLNADVMREFFYAVRTFAGAGD